MGTSSMTIIRNRIKDYTSGDCVDYNNILKSSTKEKDVDIMKFYRHYDSYVSGHGRDIAIALCCAAESISNSKLYVNNRNWCQHFLKHLLSLKMDIEFLDVDSDDDCVDYIYIITGQYDNFGGKFSIDEDMYLDRITIDVMYEDGTSVFSGSAKEYIDFVYSDEQ